MNTADFARFKYDYSGPVCRSKARVVVSACCAVAAVVSFVFGVIPAGFVLTFAALFAWFAAPRILLVGPRYLLCGDAILYYRNVKSMTLSTSKGRLGLTCLSGQVFVLERDKFPTGARKTDKIAKNKAQKFDKVSAKIMDKVRAASPQVEMGKA